MNFELLLLNHKFTKAPIFSFFYHIDQFHNCHYLNLIMDNQVLKAINHKKTCYQEKR